ncbi:hypothetical protein CANTEDRAFT_133526, partial [Yamadazyma tenuis ATCC 10573]
MEDELKFYAVGYRDLSGQLAAMRDHLHRIRSVFLNHKSCPSLVSQLGGYTEMNHFLDQLDYITSISEKNSGNLVSLPTTIPTTLGSTSDNYVVPPAPTSTIGHNLPMADTSGANSVNGYDPVSNNISAHHSMTNLQAAGAPGQATTARGGPDGGTNIHQPQATDIRTINSMSDLASLNQNGNIPMNDPHHPDKNFGLRPVNSMVNLHPMNHHQNGLVDLSNDL